MAQDSTDFVERARAQLARRQHQEAVRICRLGLLAQPQRVEGRLVLGMALLAQERFDEVLAEVRVALDIDPRSALGWLLRGEALAGQGDYAQAEDALVRARELDPSSERVDPLLADVRTALAAGLEGSRGEATDTREYPADVGERLWGGDGSSEAAQELEAALLAGVLPADTSPDRTGPTELPPILEISSHEPTERAIQGRGRGERPDEGGDDGTSPSVILDQELLATRPREPDERGTLVDGLEGRLAFPADDETPLSLVDGDEAPTAQVRLPAATPRTSRRAQSEETARVVPRFDEVVPGESTARIALPRERPGSGDGGSHESTAEVALPRRGATAAAATAQVSLPRERGSSGEATAQVPLPGGRGRRPSGPWPRPSPPASEAAAQRDLPAPAARPGVEARPRTSSSVFRNTVGDTPPPRRLQPVRVAPSSGVHPRGELRPSPPPLQPRPPLLDDEPSERRRPRLDDEAAGGTAPATTSPPGLEELSWSEVELEGDLLEEEEAEPDGNEAAANDEGADEAGDEGAATPTPPPAAPPPVVASADLVIETPTPAPVADAPRRPPTATTSPPPSVVVAASLDVDPRRRRTSRGAAGRVRPLPAPRAEAPDGDDEDSVQPTHRVPRMVEEPTARRPLPERRPGVEPRPGRADPRPRGSRQLDPEPPTAPVAWAEAPSRPPPRRRWQPRAPHTVLTRERRSRLSSPLLLLGVAVVAVALIAGATGFVLREYRTRARVERRRETAKLRLAAGTYSGYQSAAEEYRRLLADRPSDEAAKAFRARLLATLAFEFGDPIEPAVHAVSALGDDAGEDASIARAYLALHRGDEERAERLVTALSSRHPGARADYLLGRFHLAAEHPDEAARAIRLAADREPSDPLFLHGLGLAEAARRRDQAALEAFSLALERSPNHVASIVDRAALQVRRGRDLAQAESFLDSAVGKLTAEASPSELARAYLALAELRLIRGDLEGSRGLLVRAAARRPPLKDSGDLALAESLALGHLRAFELAAAATEAERVIEAAKGRSTAHLVLALVALQRGRPDEALRHVERANTNRPEVLAVRGRTLLALGKLREARPDLDAALRLAPDDAETRVAHARLEIAEGRTTQALHELQLLEQRKQAPALVAAALGETLLALRQNERARYWFSEGTRRNPPAIEARLGLARLNRLEGRLEEARGELKRALQANAEYAPAWRELAALSLDAGDATAARDEYDAILARAPDDVVALVGSARARLLLGELPTAAERLERALKAGARGEEVAVLRATVLVRSGRPTEALPILQPLVATAERGETVALYLQAGLRAGRPLPAQALARLVPSRLRNDPAVLTAQARLLAEAGRSSAAEALSISVLRRAGTLPGGVKAEAHATLGRALYDQGSTGTAAQHLAEALRLDPTNPRAAFQLALVLEDRHSADEARKWMEQAVRSDPAFTEAWFELGRLRAQAGDPGAAEAFQTCLRLDPRSAYADEARRALRSLGGR